MCLVDGEPSLFLSSFFHRPPILQSPESACAKLMASNNAFLPQTYPWSPKDFTYGAARSTSPCFKDNEAELLVCSGVIHTREDFVIPCIGAILEPATILSQPILSKLLYQGLPCLCQWIVCVQRSRYKLCL